MRLRYRHGDVPDRAIQSEGEYCRDMRERVCRSDVGAEQMPAKRIRYVPVSRASGWE